MFPGIRKNKISSRATYQRTPPERCCIDQMTCPGRQSFPQSWHFQYYRSCISFPIPENHCRSPISRPSQHLLGSVHIRQEVHDPDAGQEEHVNLAYKLLFLFFGPCQATIDLNMLGGRRTARLFAFVDQHVVLGGRSRNRHGCLVKRNASN